MIDLEYWAREHWGKFIKVTLENGKVFMGRAVHLEFENPLDWIEEDAITLDLNHPDTRTTLPTREIAKIELLDKPAYYDPNR
ncbi:hypothetical protein [Helicobacter vulpis]|uniref:hypothetical protein n=1 Tax=Helicobacter vulpis TaxID=2316076 RepID=UPI000EABC2D0|nr:hypothetical protein [Helicobacter vulpis]